jgi:hypothetical protein
LPVLLPPDDLFGNGKPTPRLSLLRNVRDTEVDNWHWLGEGRASKKKETEGRTREDEASSIHVIALREPGARRRGAISCPSVVTTKFVLITGASRVRVALLIC